MAVLFPGGQGLCSEALERGHSRVPFGVVGSELAWKPRAVSDSAPTVGASEILHQGMGVLWGNAVFSSFCGRDATAKRFSGLRHVFTDRPAFLFIL